MDYIPSVGELVRIGELRNQLMIVTAAHGDRQWHGRNCTGGFAISDMLWRATDDDRRIWIGHAHCRRIMNADGSWSDAQETELMAQVELANGPNASEYQVAPGDASRRKGPDADSPRRRAFVDTPSAVRRRLPDDELEQVRAAHLRIDPSKRYFVMEYHTDWMRKTRETRWVMLGLCIFCAIGGGLCGALLVEVLKHLPR